MQLAIDEADIHKTAFCAGSSELYKFTRMPFGLSNAGASFCHLMEMCLGDQQYLTLLFYLDYICVFSSSVDEMLDIMSQNNNSVRFSSSETSSSEAKKKVPDTGKITS